MGNVGFICSPDGVKSSYEIGCIKAIKELNSDIGCVAGTLMGSLNAALIALGDMDAMIRFWRSASKMGLTSIAGGISGKYIEEWAQYDHTRFIIKYLTFVTSEDSRMQAVRNLLNKFIAEDKLRNSPVKCAIIGISPYTFSPEVYTIDRIPKGQLVDYLMCSALYPAVALAGNDYKVKIPASYSAYRAMEEFSPSLVISTDEISERCDSHAPLRLIRPSEMIRITSVESAEDMIRNIRLGYVDTLREVSFSYGNIFYVNRITDYPSSLKNLISSDIPINKKELLCRILRLREYSSGSVTDRLSAMANGSGLKGSDLYLCLLENAADLLGVEKSEKYTDKTLQKALVKKMEELFAASADMLMDEDYVIRVITSARTDAFLSPDRVAEYFLVLYALDGDNYNIVKSFVGALHLKVILAIVVMIYLAD